MSIRIFFLLTLIAIACNAFAKDEPHNLQFIKEDLIRYHDSGEYNYQLRQVVEQAENYLNRRIIEDDKTSDKRPLAIILDIDETSLSNYAKLVNLNFGGTTTEIAKAVQQPTDPAIKPTLALYQDAKKHHIAVFFITGRNENMRTDTINNLTKAGYQAWDGLYMRPLNYQQKSIIPFKSGVRKELNQKYDIVINMGDQYSDLSGGYADHEFKLPNPYYYIP